MIGDPEMPTAAGGAREPGEDSVEVELTAAQQLEVSQAATEAARTPEIVPGKPGYDSFVCRRTQRIDIVSTLTFAALVLGITAASSWHALIGQPTAPASTVAIAVPLAPARAVNEQPRGPVLQVIAALHDSSVGRGPTLHGQRDANRPLITDDGDFRGRAVRHNVKERDNRVGRKVDVTNGLIVLVQDRPER